MTPARFEKAMVTALAANLNGGPVALPSGGGLLWRWFGDLNNARQWHANGPQAISFTEIAAWARLTGWPLSARHVAVLTTMDAEWRRAWYATGKDRDADGTRVLRRGANQPLSAALFDAAFG